MEIKQYTSEKWKKYKFRPTQCPKCKCLEKREGPISVMFRCGYEAYLSAHNGYICTAECEALVEYE